MKRPFKQCTCGKWVKNLPRHRKTMGCIPITRLQNSKFIKQRRNIVKHKPMYTSSLVQVKPGQTIPETFLHKLCTENRSAIGIVVRSDKGIDIEKHKIVDDVEETMKMMKTVQENTKKFSRMFTFHSFPDDYDEDAELQPYVLIKDSKGNPLLCVGIEGDFPKYVDTSPDGFSEAFKLVDDWLGDKVQSMFKILGNNPSKVYDWLQSEQFSKDFHDQIGHRGCLYFMPSTGNMFAQEKNDIGVDAGWGTASFAYGYTEAVAEAATPDTSAKEVVAPPPAPVRKSKWADDDVTLPKPEVKPPEQPVKPAETPIEKVAEAIVEEKTIDPPRGLHGKPLKEWYRKTNPSGDLPSNWRDRPSITIKTAKPKAAPKTDTAVGAALQQAEKDKANREAALVNSMPILSGDKQKAANEFIKKYIGDGSAIITDPVEAAKQEKDLPVFTQLCPQIKSVQDIERLTPGFLSAMIKQHPEATWLMILQMRSTIRDLRENGEKKLGELTGSETKEKETSTPASATPEPTPKRANKWA